MDILGWFGTATGMAVLFGFLTYMFKSKKTPVVGRMSKIGAGLLVGLATLIIMGGGLSSLSMNKVVSGDECQVSELQLNSITVLNGTGAVSSNYPDLFEWTATDAQLPSTNTIDVDITVVRSGSDACSVPITVTQDHFKSETDLADTKLYTIAEVSTNGKMEAWIETDGTGTPATSDAQESTVLGFTEGDVSNMFSVLVDDQLAEFEDEINTYSTKNIYINVGDQTARIQYMKTG